MIARAGLVAGPDMTGGGVDTILGAAPVPAVGMATVSPTSREEQEG